MAREIGRRTFLTATGAAVTAATVGTPAYASTGARDAGTANEYVDVQLLNISDLHGFLQAAPAAQATITGAGGARYSVGGVGYMASHLQRLRDGHANSIFFAPGDNFSGWELDAVSVADESTIEVLNRMGLQFATAGNHEFDKSPEFLIEHIERGVPFPEVGFDDDFFNSQGHRYKGANFRYYSGNMIWRSSGETVLPPYNIAWVDAGGGKKLPIGFIHLTVTGTETGSTSYQPALASIDEIATVNKYAAELKSRGVNAIIVSMHDGAVAGSNFNGGSNPSGPAYVLAQQVSPDIAAIVTGHWHCLFNMMVPDPDGNPRPFVEAGCYGQAINEINLKLDRQTGEVIRELTVSTNYANTPDVAKDPDVQEIADYWTGLAQRRSLITIGSQTASFTRTRNSSGESTMGDLAADWAYWCGRLPQGPMNNGNAYPNVPADLALIAIAPRTGSTVIAGDLIYNVAPASGQRAGAITFGQAWGTIGYGDPILTATVSGKQIHDALEEQWTARSDGTVQFAPLAVSYNVRYSFDAGQPPGNRVDPADVLIDGEALDVTKNYRLATTAYTFLGADGYSALTTFSAPYRHIRDFEGWIKYVRAHPELSPSQLDRVTQKSPASAPGVGAVGQQAAAVRLRGGAVLPGSEPAGGRA